MVDAFKHLILSIPTLSIYKRVLFFVLRYCVVKYANIFYSCCKESSCPEFGNLRQQQFFHVGINIILRTRRINTRERFFLQHLVPNRMKISPLVGFLDEGTEIDPRLFGNWLALLILNLTLIKATLCNEVQDI
jgi:hypothetical protein